MEPWEGQTEQPAVQEAVRSVTPEEADAVLDELVSIASKMAMERATEWSGGAAQNSLDRRMEFAQELLRQEDELRMEQPEFDLERMLRDEPAFRALVMAGEPLKKALEYVRPEQGMRRAEQEVLERIRRRNLRPQTMEMGGRPAEPSIEERLSEEEMRRIDGQLKRGRKVYLNY